MNDEGRPEDGPATLTSARVDSAGGSGRRARPSAAQRLATPGAVLSRSDLRDLGFERRAIDAIFRELNVVVIPGYKRPLIAVDDYLELLERNTYAGDRVRA